jgi:hypothetical protein
VIATRSCLWLQTLTVSVWLKSTWLFGIWLQACVVCDCKNYFVCVIATILCVWLLPEVICGCKTWLCLCGWNLLGYLVYDCKTAWSFVIAKPILCVSLQTQMVVFYDCKKKKRTELVCDCNYFACVIATRSYLWLQTLTVSVWLKST